MMSAAPSDRMYWIAWATLPLIGARRLHALAAAFGSLESAWRAPDAAIAAVLGEKVAGAATAARRGADPDARAVAACPRGSRIVTWVDPDFPASLRDIPDPPGVLWLRGTMPASPHLVAIVGSREPSAYGDRVARMLGRDLSALGACVVSGAAAGIDRAAHEGALVAEGGRTIAVLGCPIDQVYPAHHRRLYGAIADSGCLVSEYPPGDRPSKWSFPQRNRLIAGLSQGVIVVEAKARSGSLITADFALEQGKPVGAVPGPIDGPGSEGPHGLLRQGARLVTSSLDVIEELGWALSPVARRAPTDPAALAVLALLAEGPRPLASLAAALGLAAAEAQALMLRLELDGIVRQLPGARYTPA